MKKLIGLTIAILLGTSSLAFALVVTTTEAVPAVQGMTLPAGEGATCLCNMDPSTINSVQEAKAAAVHNVNLPSIGAVPTLPTPSSGTDTQPGG